MILFQDVNTPKKDADVGCREFSYNLLRKIVKSEIDAAL